jgi:hypothetical protein
MELSTEHVIALSAQLLEICLLLLAFWLTLELGGFD